MIIGYGTSEARFPALAECTNMVNMFTMQKHSKLGWMTSQAL
uniref:Uncharacterized protein n=1 Tax=Lotus japonicus TaxID=34305 RepID=I3SCV4_LOTJA|nr:unknown [Lotus japonicus]